MTRAGAKIWRTQSKQSKRDLTTVGRSRRAAVPNNTVRPADRKIPGQRRIAQGRWHPRVRSVPRHRAKSVRSEMSPDLGILRIEARMYRMYRDSGKTYMCACVHARMCGVSSHRRYIRYISSFSLSTSLRNQGKSAIPPVPLLPPSSQKRYTLCLSNTPETPLDLGKQQRRCVPFLHQQIRYAHHHSPLRVPAEPRTPTTEPSTGGAVTIPRSADRERSAHPELLTTKETTMRTQTIASAINTLSGLLSEPQASFGGPAAVVALSATRAHLVDWKVSSSHEVGRTGPTLKTFGPVA
jgi:hypothetical protein